jgi:hypothetical protein
MDVTPSRVGPQKFAPPSSQLGRHASPSTFRLRSPSGRLRATAAQSQSPSKGLWMPDTTCHMSISLDGFVAGPDQSPEHPLGKRGVELHG